MSDSGVTIGVAGLLQLATMVTGFLTLWVKLKYAAKKAEDVEGKLDSNTRITAAGAAAAAVAAQDAAATASKLNGGVDKAVAEAIEPLQKALDDHARRIETLDEYVHRRNHDLLTALQAQTNKLEAVLVLLRQQKGEP